MKAINVGIIGVSGYTGLELVKMLISHPIFNLVYCANTEGATTVSDLHPALMGVCDLNVEKVDIERTAQLCELVFLALPHKTAMQTAKGLLAKGLKVVDLSADYRLSQENYEAFYCEHEDLDNLSHAVYSIPELHGKRAEGAKLIANPGCHVTATLMALAPFLDHIDLSQPIFVDSKTGVSGAGKSPSATVHYVSVNDNINCYNIIKHRHATEIEQHASALCDGSVKVTFVPSLVPMTRGMLACVYATLKDDCDPLALMEAFYNGKPFVRLRKAPPHTKMTSGTNFADVYATRHGNALVAMCAIDNLMRGASSQALANANIMMGLDETLGIPRIAYVP
ncbi:N-acetyl-gamma-glutamyl-phosphate reductase [Sulfuricurvum kujiense DSM 16994]|uniref:N-acetyl-gamma-glutamyl-phosphate reductase n=1 Tax=Sulfuricurvum kujiense (strain ATCC BAA-921 / DSM 16994 / JCM 11577 / YK-1) TaxID=709032 RepID=E4U0D2_SULKY|nr:N-acetyl-gamma-glutamyl-phosphate reductase [Sulfuricurvum kujiense]ADR33229.1 N-acetyl-gamma-glutamyl-phosphate reductase [Sulfuricurvum kujiense DSM 16994]